MPDVPLVVPLEYRKAGITAPLAAAEHSSDIVGILACRRAADSATEAERKGAFGEAAFYRAVLAILLEWYDKPPVPVTGDEDLPAFIDNDEPPAPAAKPKKRRKAAGGKKSPARAKTRGRTKPKSRPKSP